MDESDQTYKEEIRETARKSKMKDYFPFHCYESNIASIPKLNNSCYKKIKL